MAGTDHQWLSGAPGSKIAGCSVQLLIIINQDPNERNLIMGMLLVLAWVIGVLVYFHRHNPTHRH